MKTAFALIAISFLAGAGSARAEFTFACGANSEQGVDQAQVAFVDSLDGPMKLMLAGHAVADEKLGVKSLDKGRWLVSVDEGANLGVRQFVFVQGAGASVQLSRVSEKGDLMKGAKLPCLFVQK
jgi:hypothetical protein